MGDFLCWFSISLVVLPIPIGYFWVWVYRNRKLIGLPDWFSGLLAQGVISGHKISEGDADEDDYTFIIIATIVSTLIVLILLYLLLAMFGAIGNSQSPNSGTALTLINNSGQSVCYVYISFTTSETWGRDWLGSSETIPNGSRRTFGMSSGTYDLKADNCNSDSIAETYGERIVGSMTWTLGP